MSSVRVASLRRVLLAASCAVGSGAFAQTTPSAPALRATTNAGQIEGARAGEVAVFRGLPYAAPPVGNLRWRAPETAAPWAGVRKADAFGKACPQDRGASIDQAGDPGPTSEDCLFLNVWTPRTDAAAKLPVMVWIHGGAFVIGAGSQSLYDGTALAGRGAVVVTLNYRLGTLGFFSHPSLDRVAPGGPVNFGLLDQIAALRWVRDNITAFGGDPQNVTIFGESAGAQSVLALFSSPLARGLFHKGIAQSAYGFPSYTRARAQTVGIAVAAAVSTASQASQGGASVSLAQLRAMPAERFTALKGAGLSLHSAAVVGDAALPDPVLATFQRGGEAALPLVIGSNSDEASVAIAFGIEPAALVKRLGAARIAIKPLYPGQNDEALLGRAVVRDAVFTAYARRLAYLHSTRAPTWRYYYSRVPASLRTTWPGVPHGGEIADVFGVDDACGCLAAPLTDADRAASRRVGDRWFAFARDGAPASLDDIAWPRDGRQRAQTMEFGDESVIRTDFMKPRLNAFIGALKVLGYFGDRR